MYALTSMRPPKFSGLPPSCSVAVIDWSRAFTEPPATLGVPPTPPAFPMPTTASPRRTVDESPSDATFRADASCSFSTAMSLERS